MSHIVIDGYNLLAQSHYQSREELLKQLKIYKKSQGHEVTIFFDGTHQGTGSGDKFHEEYVEIIFTPLTVTADDMIEEYIEKHHHSSMIIVSSDRRIQKAANAKNLSFLESSEFLVKIRNPQKTSPFSMPWMEGRTTGEEDYAKPRGGKKGNPQKKSKQERKKLRSLKKL